MEASEKSTDAMPIGSALPLLLVEEAIHATSADHCESLFALLERRRELLMKPAFVPKRGNPASKLSLIRTCNALLRRLSEAQDTAFRGRVLMFLSFVLPLSERSGLNLKSATNTDVAVVTASEHPVDSDSESTSKMRHAEPPGKVDWQLYRTFWGLQRIFADPGLALESAEAWRTFSADALQVLSEMKQRVRKGRAVSATATPGVREGSGSGTLSDAAATAAGEDLTTSTAMDTSASLGHDAGTGDGTDEAFDSESASQDEVDRAAAAKIARYTASPHLLGLQLEDAEMRLWIAMQVLLLEQGVRNIADARRPDPVVLKAIEETSPALVSEAMALVDASGDAIITGGTGSGTDRRGGSGQGARSAGSGNGDQPGSGSTAVSAGARLGMEVRELLRREQGWLEWKRAGSKTFELPEADLARLILPGFGARNESSSGGDATAVPELIAAAEASRIECGQSAGEKDDVDGDGGDKSSMGMVPGRKRRRVQVNSEERSSASKVERGGHEVAPNPASDFAAYQAAMMKGASGGVGPGAESGSSDREGIVESTTGPKKRRLWNSAGIMVPWQMQCTARSQMARPTERRRLLAELKEAMDPENPFADPDTSPLSDEGWRWRALRVISEDASVPVEPLKGFTVDKLDSLLCSLAGCLTPDGLRQAQSEKIQKSSRGGATGRRGAGAGAGARNQATAGGNASMEDGEDDETKGANASDGEDDGELQGEEDADGEGETRKQGSRGSRLKRPASGRS